MAKLTLTDTASGYNLTPINNNFDAIVAELQDKVLYRDNPVGEPNQMENDIDLNGNNLLNVNTLNGADVSNLDADLSTVAGLSTEIQALAAIEADIVTVAGDSADIQSIAASIADVNTVASNLTPIQTVSNGISYVQTVSNSIADVQNVSNNLDAVHNFGDLYLGEKTSNPTLDNDGEPLLTGALYFNSVANGGDGEIRIYNGASWDPAAFSATAANGVTYNNGSTFLDETDVQAAVTALANGYLTEVIDASGGDFVLDETLAVREIVITGSPGPTTPIEVTLPSLSRTYKITNRTTQQNDVTVKASGGTGVVIPNNGTITDSATVQFDGSDYVAVADSARHIPFDNSISTIASENVQDALDEIENSLGSAASQTYTTTIVNVNTGDFVSDPWNLYLTKIGSTVLASADSLVTHTSATNRVSADGEVFAPFLPPNSVDNVFFVGSNRLCKMRITAAGAVILSYYDETFTLATAANSLGVPHISYIVP